MKYRNLGHTGVEVSEVSLGSWLTYGYTVDENIAGDTIISAYQNGINFFDTADVYHRHEAERTLGAVLQEVPRTDLFIGSKVYFPIGDGPNDRGLSRKHIFESIENSLTALDMDYLDLYQCHRFDNNTPLEETVRAMSDLVSRGMIHYWGVSMWSAAQIREACQIADRVNGFRPISNQPVYNLLERQIEVNDVQQTLENLGLGLVVFSPLAQGVLTGKYADGEIPEDSRAADDKANAFMDRYLTNENVKKSAELVEIADELGSTAAIVSLAWLLRQPAMCSVIVGASKPVQVEENIQASELELSGEVLERLNQLFPATDHGIHE